MMQMRYGGHLSTSYFLIPCYSLPGKQEGKEEKDLAGTKEK